MSQYKPCFVGDPEAPKGCRECGESFDIYMDESGTIYCKLCSCILTLIEPIPSDEGTNGV
jgi:hypothetical protein